MKKFITGILVAALAITVTACNSKTAEAPNQTNASVAETKQVVEAFGIAKTKEIKNINLSFPATVEKVNVSEGQRVKSGETLMILDINEYKAQLKNKELELKAIQSEINLIRANINGSGPDMAKLQGDLQNAEDLYERAVKEQKDKEVLFKAGAISQYDLDEFTKNFNAKKKAVDDAELAMNTLRDNKSTELDQKQNQASQLESDIALMQDKLGKGYIKDNNIISDVNTGVVYEIGYKQGDNVSSEKKLLSIMDLDSLIIEAEVPEEFIKDVKMGAEVTIIPTLDKSKSFKGKVTRISDKAVQKNGETNIIVEITMDEKNDFIMPEYNVDVKIKV